LNLDIEGTDGNLKWGVWLKLFFVVVYVLSGGGETEKNILVLFAVVDDGKSISAFIICFCSRIAIALTCWRSWKTGTNCIAVPESWDINFKKSAENVLLKFLSR
jgi:hypothetical protein